MAHTYSLTTTLKRLSFLIDCKMFHITPNDIPDSVDQALTNNMQILVNHAYVSDLGIPEMEVRHHWPLLTAAIQKCQAAGGLTEDNLQNLLKVVVEFGRGKIAWDSRISMDGSGKLCATQAP